MVICDNEWVENKCFIPPRLYADFKALVGDKADNIKGAEKTDVKTAARLLHQYGGLREIIDKADRESIVKDKDRLLTNYELIKLNDRARIPFPIEALHYDAREMKTNDVLKGIGLK